MQVKSPPILIIGFNRPDKIMQLLDVLESYQDAISYSHVYFAIDGPRASKPGEDSRVQEVVAHCQAFAAGKQASFLIQPHNLGCGKAVQAALDWFFRYEEYGIILEDDILPSRFFFQFMRENLEKYKSDPKVFSVNGHALGFTQQPYTGYGITPYFNMWGWGTWRRSNELVQDVWYNWVLGEVESITDRLSAFDLAVPWRRKMWRHHWQHNLKHTALGTLDTWDYQWVYTAKVSGSVCVRPNYNLTENTGYDGSGTHTFSSLQGQYLNLAVIPDAEGQQVQHPKKPTAHWKYELYHVPELWNGITLNPIKICIDYFRRFININ